jgi:S1-C subfamily serine protease
VKCLAPLGILLLAACPVFGQVDFARPAGPALGASSRASPARPHPAVVRVVVPGRDTVSYGSGTLVAVTEKHGLVLTNWHVVEEATGPVRVVFPDGFQSAGTVMKIDQDWDLAAIGIWKPKVDPVPLATEPPRPGDALVIAGYGSGEYRAVAGRCTQYVAPGPKAPYEMVELSVAARQGDSGGPIFNRQGQLAGVLFGAGRGTTSGSYCGRVQRFLVSVMPDFTNPRGSYVAAQPAQGAAGTSGALAQADSTPRTAAPLESNARVPSQRDSVAQIASAPLTSHAARAEPRAPAASVPTAPGAVSTQPEEIGWKDIAGETVGDQIRTALAAVGVLALLFHGLKWLGRESEEAG